MDAIVYFTIAGLLTGFLLSSGFYERQRRLILQRVNDLREVLADEADINRHLYIQNDRLQAAVDKLTAAAPAIVDYHEVPAPIDQRRCYLAGHHVRNSVHRSEDCETLPTHGMPEQDELPFNVVDHVGNGDNGGAT